MKPPSLIERIGATLVATTVLICDRPSVTSAQEEPRRETHAQVTRALKNDTETPAEKVEIVARKIPVYKNPRAKAPALHVYSGMQVIVRELKMIGTERWGRFEIQGNSYWLNLSRNVNKSKNRASELVKGHRLVIDKRARTMSLMSANDGQWKRVLDAKIAIGYPGDASPKKEAGDFLTPTGYYFVSWKNPASQFGKTARGGKLCSLEVSYPNISDGWRALNERRISLHEYNSIVAAEEAKRMPPRDTGLGNYVMVHGGGADGDWTLGCIAAPDPIMEKLCAAVPEGTPIEIK